ncbi:MAG: type II secretion system F family protein [Planctomycetota bacterium]
MAFFAYIPAAVPFGTSPMDLVLSVGIFVAVMLLIVGVFSQPGRVRRSAEREAAIATGHTDRKTVFESSALRPLMWLLLAISHRLAMPRVKRWVRRKLLAEGNPSYYTPEEYLSVALLTGVALLVAIELLNLLVTGQLTIFWGVVGFAGGVFLSLYQLHDRSARRVREISKRLPYTLDLISLAMSAGATFTEAVQTVVRENPEDPLNTELRSLLAEIDLGTTRRRALRNLTDRIPLSALHSIVASIIQAEELGTPLSDVLHDQSALLRQRRWVRAENAAAAAGVKILVPCLLLVMAVMLAVFGPFIVRFIRGDLF